MPAYVPPHRRPGIPAQQAGDRRLPPTRSQRRTPQSTTSAQPTPPSGVDNITDSTPVWRGGAAAGAGPVGSAAVRPNLLARRPPGPGLSIANSVGSGVTPSSPFAATSFTSAAPPPRTQTADEVYRYQSVERSCISRQPKPIKAEECEEDKEYAQWAGGYVEVNDKLLSEICPCNLVGKPCPFDELEEGCPMIRLCGQLEKVFGAVNYYDSSENESGDEALDSSTTYETDSSDANTTDLEPNYYGKKVSFNDFSCGVKNSCGHIHWEVDINCRFVAWYHYKKIPCKQVLEKGRLCSCGHDLESSRQAARDAVTAHERSAVRAGAPQARDMGKRWVY
jgi:hypothetical protein